MAQLCQIPIDLAAIGHQPFHPYTAMTYFCIKDSLTLSISIHRIVFKNLFRHLEMYPICLHDMKHVYSGSHLSDPKYIKQPGYLKIFHWLGMENKRRHSDVKTANKSHGPKNV